MGYRYLDIVSLRIAHPRLHLLDKLLIAEEYLPFELRPRRWGLDAFGHKLCVAGLRHAAPLGKLRQQAFHGEKRSGRRLGRAAIGRLHAIPDQ